MKPKRKVRITSLAARFYRRDGWTLDELQSLMKKYIGSDEPAFRFFDDIYTIAGVNIFDYAYWLPSQGVEMDIERLLNDYDLELYGQSYWPELQGKSMEFILRDRLR